MRNESLAALRPNLGMSADHQLFSRPLPSPTAMTSLHLGRGSRVDVDEMIAYNDTTSPQRVHVVSFSMTERAPGEVSFADDSGGVP